MTASTLPVLVLIAFLWWRTKGELLPIILMCSVFDASAAVVVAGSAVVPWILALAICLPIKIITGTLQWKPMVGTNKGAYHAMFLFVGYAFFSAMVCPFVFHGILVSNSHNGMNQPLAWTFSNFAQPSYLLCAMCVYLIAVHSTREQQRNAIDWFIYAAVTVASFMMYQLANAVLHVPYPSAILYTNTTHVIYDAYKIGGVWRLNGTQTEASAAAFFLAIGLALQGWQLATHRIRWQSAAAFLLMLTALVLTVSTTGYACMVTLALSGILLYARHSFRKGGAAPVKVLIALALIGVAVPAFLLTNAGQTVSKVLMTVFVDKMSSDSYRERSMMNSLALQTAHDSYYFGAGWGSVRASSFACSLFGNVGIPGALLFAILLMQLAKPLLKPRRYVRLALFERTLYGVFVMMVAQLVAGADLISPIIWTMFGIATASKPLRRASAAVPAPSLAPADPLPLQRPTLVT
ncbi:O-antigen ligase [Acidipila sp. EB88]|uniref:O-antigen ligase family protein n=1 Tax=Acidipila sp. EB88 TaxID=2305226 RepID=UPI000F5E78D6|nr:hypothetical protein [Acidipila sp. EB88]RRA47254.1 hypothetical protein D1Y84_02055 [Acidipila sp. EB88]